MLKIENLHASVDGNEILKGVNLTVGTGEIHAIMGPNGSGKSTLAQILAGHEAYEATGGTVTYEGKDLLGLGPEERAREGVFLAFQYPVEIPGVNSAYFLRTGLNEIRKHHGEEIEAMGTRQLKDELKRRDVPHAHCVEKSELLALLLQVSANGTQ